MKSILKLLLLISSTIYAQIALSSNVDVVGIKFGMNPDEVRAAVRAHNPDLMALERADMRRLTQSSPNKIKSLTFSRGYTKEEESFGAPNGLIMERIEVVFGLVDGAAYHISRVQNYYPPIDTEKFRLSLASKYKLQAEKSVVKGLEQKVIIEGMYANDGKFDYEAMRNGKCSSWGRQVPHIYKSTCNGVTLHFETVVDDKFKDKTHSFRIHSTDHRIFYKSIIDAQAVVEADRESQRKRIDAVGGSGPKL